MQLEQLLEHYNDTGEVPPHPVLLQRTTAGLTDDQRTVFVLFPQQRELLILGRSSDVALTLPDPNVSSKHAQLLSPKPGSSRWYLVDLGSTNGSFLENHPLQPHKPLLISDMDTIRLGPASHYHFLEPGSLKRVLQSIVQAAGRGKGAQEPTDAKPAQTSQPEPRQRPPAKRPPQGDRPGPRRTARRPPPAPGKQRPTEQDRPARKAPPVAAPLAKPPAAAEPHEPPARIASKRTVTQLPDDFVEKLLKEARRAAASDVHLTPTIPPTLRINGELVRRGESALSASDTKALIEQVTDEAQHQEFLRTGDLDTCQQIGGYRYRLNAAQSRGGCVISFRVISEKVPTLEELGIPAVAEELTKFAQGMVLITGPLGAGKTTTMFSLVDLVNRTRPEHVITIEDPVEFLLPPQKCQVAQRERGRDTASFGAALRGALREDPDIIVIGDLRDYETASLAISAAETGHLVFASMATMNAMKSIDKLIDLFPAGEQATTRTMFSESLRGILCQHLLPGTDGKRVPAVELVFNSIAVSNIIRDGNTAALLNAMQTGKAQGMRSFETSIKELLDRRAISPETAAKARAG